MNLSKKIKLIGRITATIGIFIFLVTCSKNQDIPLGVVGGGLSGAQQELAVNVGDRVFFAVDSSVLSFEAQNTLSNQAEWLNQNPTLRVTIEGHADERGTRQYNLALSARRATAVRDYLVGLGVSSNRISTSPYGKERPVALCNDSSCWSQNRRGVTVVDSGLGS